MQVELPAKENLEAVTSIMSACFGRASLGEADAGELTMMLLRAGTGAPSNSDEDDAATAAAPGLATAA